MESSNKLSEYIRDSKESHSLTLMVELFKILRLYDAVVTNIRAKKYRTYLVPKLRPRSAPKLVSTLSLSAKRGDPSSPSRLSSIGGKSIKDSLLSPVNR